MDNERIHRYGGAALVVSAGCLALFWILAASIGTFAGADAARRSSWIPSQAFHAIGALLSIFGYISVYAVERRLSGWSGLVGFVIATTGNVLFFADGLIALAIFPALAVSAPVALSASGAMNQGGVLVMFVAIAAINMIGQVIFGIATWRARVFPSGASALIIIGGILFNLPPGVVPMIVLAIGGCAWSGGALWLGTSLMRRA